MQQVNLHQKKLFALLEAAFAIIALLLPWTTYKIGQMGGFGGGGNIPSDNGFRSWGYLVVVGVIGVLICSLLGDKRRDYDNNMKLGAMASFAAIALGAIIYLIRLNNVGPLQEQNTGAAVTVSAGMGLWLALAAGVIGLAWVSGILSKLNANATAATAPSSVPGPPPPPPPPPTNP
jgi:hypothetical protein